MPNEMVDTQPITVRWIDTVKKDGTHRSRLVAREIKTYEDHDLYTATPPVESARLILTELAARRGRDGDDHQDPWVLTHVDVHRAYF